MAYVDTCQWYPIVPRKEQSRAECQSELRKISEATCEYEVNNPASFVGSVCPETPATSALRWNRLLSPVTPLGKVTKLCRCDELRYKAKSAKCKPIAHSYRTPFDGSTRMTSRCHRSPRETRKRSSNLKRKEGIHDQQNAPPTLARCRGPRYRLSSVASSVQ
jgi:hypothetical protein